MELLKDIWRLIVLIIVYLIGILYTFQYFMIETHDLSKSIGFSAILTFLFLPVVLFPMADTNGRSDRELKAHFITGFLFILIGIVLTVIASHIK